MLSFIACTMLISCSVTHEQALNEIMSDYSARSEPGAAVLVMMNDSILFKQAYGVADVESKAPIATTTNFRLASVTKQFTAMCIMLLVERGELSYEDSLPKFFPTFPECGKGITIRHLLTHTSGLVDYESLIPVSQTTQVFDKDCLDLLMRIDSLYFPIGSKYQYSNTGYAFLAMIVEKVSGKRFADFLRENIFQKIGMTTTVAFENGISAVQNRAFGHSFKDGTWTKTDQSVTSAVLGDGGIYSNVEELAKWISSLYHHTLISEASQALAWTRANLNDGSSIDYGFGWHIGTHHGIQHPFHGGSTMGFRNAVQLFPDEQLMVVILTNRSKGEPELLALKIADVFLNRR